MCNLYGKSGDPHPQNNACEEGKSGLVEMCWQQNTENSMNDK